MEVVQFKAYAFNTQNVFSVLGNLEVDGQFSLSCSEDYGEVFFVLRDVEFAVLFAQVVFYEAVIFAEVDSYLVKDGIVTRMGFGK